MLAEKALVRLHIWAGLSIHLLLAYGIMIEIHANSQTDITQKLSSL